MGTTAKLVAGVVSVALAGAGLWWGIHQQAVASNRGYVVSQLRDPDSVQFRNERVTDAGWLCGEMNGKNAYGAYAGFKQFLSRASDDVHIEGSGYVGKKGAQSTRQIIDGLDVSIKTMQELLAAAKASPGLPTPTQAEIDAATERAIFEKLWADHCT